MTNTLQKPRERGTIERVEETGARGRATLLVVAMTVLLTGTVLALVFLLSGPAGLRAEPGRLDLADGSLSLVAVRPEVMNHPKNMPASMMPNPVPEGYVRYGVEITLESDGEPLEYAASGIRLRTPGETATGPVRESLGEGTIPPGARLTTILVYEVPEDARRATLLFDGRELDVRLPHGAGHHAPEDSSGGTAPEVVGGAEVQDEQEDGDGRR